MGETRVKSRLWHNMAEEDLIRELSTSLDSGLSSDDIEEKRNLYGWNLLPERKSVPSWRRFLNQFDNVLIYVLLASSLVTAYLQDWLDTLVIWAVVLVNAIIGFIQEGRAENSLRELRKMLSLSAQVLREGDKQLIKAEELVPGDVVYLRTGDKVPADLRLLEMNNLKIEESPLTGESHSVEKRLGSIPLDSPLAERFNMAYSGTTVVSGSGLGVVVETAKSTEIGKISDLMQGVVTLTTPLLLKINDFGKKLSFVILFFSALIFILGNFVYDYPLIELFPAIIGLVVAAIPEGLPALMTITLALGVRKMASKNAIIRLLPSVDTLGSVTVICSDKTGTLTKNEMTVKEIAIKGKSFTVEGVGYAPEGGIWEDCEDVNSKEDASLLPLVRALSLCNDSKIQFKEKQWSVIGDPTEGALLTLAKKAKFDFDGVSRVSTLPFDSAYKYMGVLTKIQGSSYCLVKGAPEKLLTLCNNQLSLQGEEPLDVPYWENLIEQFASKGLRVMAAAHKMVDTTLEQLDHDSVRDMVFLGLVGLIDPPREEVIQSIQDCHQAGISVKMITGDHATTAQAIGEQLGLSSGDRVITGPYLDQLEEDSWSDIATHHSIFARTTPKHKLDLVKALQAKGEIVAMTGDGVNDAPALKRANIGVAMGIKGTEVTKDAAEMVLADDNFASITQAIKQGRTTYDNLKKSILFILPTNGAEALVIITALLMGSSLPITPAQILWINMVTTVTLGLALAFEPGEPGVMRRKPRDPQSPILDSYLLWRVFFVSLLIGGFTYSVFECLKFMGFDLAYARTAAVNALVMGEAFYLLNCRYTHQTLFQRGFFSNPKVFYSIGTLVLIQILFTYAPVMNQLFGTVGLKSEHWGYIIAGGFLVFVLVEIEKKIQFLLGKK
jgi:P-type Ca2+ transporter type 2C